MLISKNWITSILNRTSGSQADWSVTDDEFDKGFVRVGFETEGFAPIEETTGPLVIGRVDSIEELTGFKKPIRHCFVDVGDANGTGEKQSIVCGARNFTEGDLVVVSLPGTVLPGGFAISARETYGRMSAGMICSAAELGLCDKQTKGIITLDESAGQPGDDARAVMGLCDTVFDVNVTPDRGYALSARGLVREIASSFDLDYTDPAADPSVAGISVTAPEPAGELIPVELEQETKAIRFGLAKVTGCKAGVESPIWLQRELMLCGQRPVNAATDVTNYVMMLLGQPMHAFDAAKIDGGLVVRNATAGQTLVTLDGVERTLDGEDVVICDNTGIQSLAGVMGGVTSEISDGTEDVFLEAATWDPVTVARASRRHKLTSEASRRFERSVDPALVDTALDIATSLLVQIAGGTIEPARTVVGEVPAMPQVPMPATKPGHIAGKAISDTTVINRLEEVGCTVDNSDGELTVTPPTWRSDITMHADLVEEVLRLEGLEDIPSVTPTAPAGRGLSVAQKRRRAVGHALAYNGYLEIIPTPFIANDVFDVWGLDKDDPRRTTVKVLNPLEADHAQLGSTLLPAMLEAVGRNAARGNADVTLFGVAQVVQARGGGISPMLDVSSRPADSEVEDLKNTLPAQPLHVATVGVGKLEPTGPSASDSVYDWSDAVDAALTVARATGTHATVTQAEQLPWHPGRCAAILVDGEVVGYAGELHPQILDKAELPARTCAMEMDLSKLLSATPVLPAPVLSPFPALLQDVALVVDEDTPAEEVRATVQEAAGELVETVELFDIYRSESLGEGKKSLAFALKFRAGDRTLTDDECNEAKNKAVAAAADKHGAVQRA
ncbi:phenylalanine--tRNA ligase subunit beta [Corynebacterium mendelii]|uniref:Phenylalanine--tRNA ligase beta subunit n=1 Tax=Corynebacterium mendelii TaxID=2765362 RepID=A0A939E2L1_9CORY|nr:phenylalanine--tRNA ligase subunit beta [Corynebacterium mendelii]MBN9644551.1 phenylalanine--tRNA ligase subunit beta [Corynebacterium mendelii]